MYIKLTRLDNSPIWINAAFVVTVEPRKGGGSIVVPIGDGLDYDVRETPEQVLAALDGAPAPAVVPVPAPKMLAPTPEDVSPELDASPGEPSAEEAKPAKRTRRAKKAEVDGADAPKPVKKTTRRTKRAVAEEPVADATSPAEEPAAGDLPSVDTPPPAAPAAEFSEMQLERLRKMMPRSMRKLLNTLAVQFRVAEPEVLVARLRDRGVIEVEHEHIHWK